MDQQLIKLQRNNLSYPYQVVYQREAVAEAPQKIIMRATSSVEITPEDVLVDFFTKSISLIKETVAATRKKHPALLAT